MRLKTLFVSIIFLVLPSCTSMPIKGHYLNEQFYYKIYDYSGQLVVEVQQYSVRFAKVGKKETIALGREGSSYIGRTGNISISPNKDGIAIVLGGKKQSAKRINPKKPRTEFSNELARHLLEQQIFASVQKIESSSGPCGHKLLAECKRRHLKTLFDKGEIEVISNKIQKTEKDELFDIYEGKALVKLPKHELRQKENEDCVTDFLLLCSKFKKRPIVSFSNPYQFFVEFTFASFRHTEVLQKEPSVFIHKFDGKYIGFGSIGRVHAQICHKENSILSHKSKLFYRDKPLDAEKD